MIEQAHYHHWDDQLSPGDENYWWMIGTIAEWIGYALEGSIHGCYSEPYYMSTIAVAQTKEKFGEVRAYCTLAQSSAVQRFYDKEIARINADNQRYVMWKNGELDINSRDYPSEFLIKHYNDAYPKCVPTLEEFTEARMLEDAKWYRQVYMDAIKLWPRYARAILNAADFSEFLHQTLEELDARFGRRVVDAQKWMTGESLKKHLIALKHERDFACRVSGFVETCMNEQ